MKFLAILFLFVSCSQTADNRVNQIFSGDTLLVGTQKIALLGVTAPVECHAKESKSFLEALLTGSEVTLAPGGVPATQDPNKPLAAYIYYGNAFINEEVIKNGYGFVQEEPFPKKDEFIILQEQARSLKLGMWAFCDIRCLGEKCSFK